MKDRPIYARDFVRPLIEDLTRNGEKEIYFVTFINAVMACRFAFPRILENTKKQDIIEEIDKLDYFERVEFGRKDGEAFFEYKGKLGEKGMGGLVLQSTFEEFSKTVKKEMDNERGL